MNGGKNNFYTVILTLAAVCTPLRTAASSFATPSSTTLSHYAQAQAEKKAAAAAKAETVAQGKRFNALLKQIPKNPQVGIEEARRLLREEIRPLEDALIVPLEFTAENKMPWVQEALKKSTIPRGWAGESVKRNLLKEFPNYAEEELEERTQLATKLSELRTRLSLLFSVIAATAQKPIYRTYKQLSPEQNKELEYLQAAANIVE
ncbi:hypothetical protein FJ365_04095 [Candidatus Dependentiae bacterium]|nr:hypothetical protein [Candidatus Dependentiae bacterium]